MRRTALFTLFGGVYAMTAGYWFYNVVLTTPFLVTRPYVAAVVDVVTNCPFLYYPMFYIAKSFVFETSAAWVEVRLADESVPPLQCASATTAINTHTHC
jgi:hypothetical protein